MLNKKALGATAAADKLYIEDTFSTYLYTGNDLTQTITNGIDLAGEGGLVWIKNRTTGTTNHILTATPGKALNSNTTNAEQTTSRIDAFNSNGFFINNSSTDVNQSSNNYASFTFRKAEKFFDVVTYTGNGTAGRTVAHNLGSVPGCIIVKKTNASGTAWLVYHRSLGATKYLALDQTQAADTSDLFWNDTEPTSTQFTVGTATATNNNGDTYVAYLFAHDAGGFGDDGSQNVISCGSYVGDGTSATVSLGWEPQWILIKKSSSAGAVPDWHIYDNMRGIATGGNDNYLRANLADAEVTSVNNVELTATGFIANANIAIAGETYIYIAIRRGPMKTPEAGTEVFAPTYAFQYDINGNTSSGNGIHGYLGKPTDLYVQLYLSGNSLNALTRTRLTGANYLNTSSSGSEQTGTTNFWDNNVASGFVTTNSASTTLSTLNFRRAPGFCDVVCYTGTGVARTVNHNLGVVPEMMIVKWRTGATGSNWSCYHSALGNTQVISLNEGIQAYTSTQWNNTTPTSSVFSVGTQNNVNGDTKTYVAYLFSSLAGVSKVGSYTGNGSSQTINCGFTTGARFVLIKRTDDSGDWVVFDSARGIVAGNDPFLELNTTDAEVTDKDAVDTDSTGFVVNETTGPNINTNGASYIFLAVA